MWPWCICRVVLCGQNFDWCLHLDLNFYHGVVLLWYYFDFRLYIICIWLVWVLFRFSGFALIVGRSIITWGVCLLLHLLSSFAFGCLLFNFYSYVSILLHWFERPTVATPLRSRLCLSASSVLFWLIAVNFLLLAFLTFIFGLLQLVFKVEVGSFVITTLLRYIFLPLARSFTPRLIITNRVFVAFISCISILTTLAICSPVISLVRFSFVSVLGDGLHYVITVIILQLSGEDGVIFLVLVVHWDHFQLSAAIWATTMVVSNDIFFVTYRLLDSFMLPHGLIRSDQASNAFFLN